MKFVKSTFEQYDPSYIICDCGNKIDYNSKYCKHCGRFIGESPGERSGFAIQRGEG